MTETFPVLTYALRKWVSPELLADQRKEIEAMLTAELLASVERNGLVPLPDTVSVKVFDPNYTWPEQHELPDSMSDYRMVGVTVRCYQPGTEV